MNEALINQIFATIMTLIVAGSIIYFLAKVTGIKSFKELFHI